MTAGSESDRYDYRVCGSRAHAAKPPHSLKYTDWVLVSSSTPSSDHRCAT